MSSRVQGGIAGVVPTVEAADLGRFTQALVIDLRAPVEFAQDHVPGAVNVPLLGDAERALVGTLYRRQSPEAAYDVGLAAVGERIRALVEEVAELAGWTPAVDPEGLFAAVTGGGLAGLERGLARTGPALALERPVVLHCWRGGLRSRSVVAFLRALGLDRAVALEGGYRAYRRRVLEDLERWRPPATFVLRGLTGVGKTLVLRDIERLRPGWTLDLEGLAGHRSSILGMVGLEPVPQKRFDSGLHARLAELTARAPQGPLVVEGESRKVGDSILPARVWEALQGGANAQLVAPLERRVDVLIEDYLAHPENRLELRAQLPFIERRLGPVKWDGALVALLDAGRERELVEVLLERYYDPLYLHSERGRSYALTVDTGDPARAAEQLVDWIEARTSLQEGASPSRVRARSS